MERDCTDPRDSGIPEVLCGNPIIPQSVESPSLLLFLPDRDEQTGIAVSQCALGNGINADNIRQVLKILRDHGFDGVLSMEYEGRGGRMIEKSLAWLRGTPADLGIPEEK